MTLEEYKQKHELSYDDLHHKIPELTRSTIFNICRQRGKVSLRAALMIVDQTDKEVNLTDLLH